MSAKVQKVTSIKKLACIIHKQAQYLNLLEENSD
jgi:hypothetical protein